MDIKTTFAILTLVLGMIPGRHWLARLPFMVRELATSAVFVGAVIGGCSLYMLVASPSSWRAPVEVVFAAAILTGAVLYRLKLKAQILYGVVEVAFALAMAWDAAGLHVAPAEPSKPTDFTPFFKLTAAVYLIVRGLENAHKGFATLVELAKKQDLEVGPLPTPRNLTEFTTQIAQVLAEDGSWLLKIAGKVTLRLQAASAPVLPPSDALTGQPIVELAEAPPIVSSTTSPLQPSNGSLERGAV